MCNSLLWFDENHDRNYTYNKGKYICLKCWSWRKKSNNPSTHRWQNDKAKN